MSLQSRIGKITKITKQYIESKRNILSYRKDIHDILEEPIGDFPYIGYHDSKVIQEWQKLRYDEYTNSKKRQ